MTYSIVEPDSWPRFRQAVFANAPEFPISAPNSSATALQRGTQAIGTVQTAAELAGHNVHPAIGVATGLAGSGSASDVANTAGDTGAGLAMGAFLEGVPGGNVLGLIAGNGINVLRGSIQAIMRSDEIDDYLQQFFGYKTTLARTAIHVMDQSVPYATLPQNLIPHYLETRFHGQRHRASFQRGAMRVSNVCRSMDEVTPVDGDKYSKRCFNHLFLVSAGLVTTAEGRHDFRTRERVQEYVDTHLLRRNIDRDRRRLMRYANTGS